MTMNKTSDKSIMPALDIFKCSVQKTESFMKRLLLTILFMCLITAFVKAETFNISLSQAEVPKGTMVMVYPKRPISTDSYQENDFVYFVNPADVWLGDRNIFPKNSIFVGYVNFLKLPIQGVNAAIGIKIKEVVFPGGITQELNATIYHNSEKIIGGTLAPPASYNTAIHRQGGWARGALQWVPSGEYEFGKHTTISNSEAVFVVLDENSYL